MIAFRHGCLLAPCSVQLAMQQEWVASSQDGGVPGLIRISGVLQSAVTSMQRYAQTAVSTPWSVGVLPRRPRDAQLTGFQFYFGVAKNHGDR